MNFLSSYSQGPWRGSLSLKISLPNGGPSGRAQARTWLVHGSKRMYVLLSHNAYVALITESL